MNTKLFCEFKNEFKMMMFSALRNHLSCLFKGQSCSNFTLLGNYKVGTFNFDAIFVTNTDVFLFEFKPNVAGKVYVNDSGWISPTSGNIWSGNHGARTPFEQICEKRNVLFGMLKKKGLQNMFIKTVILFEKPYKLIKRNTTLRFENHKWFLTADLANVVHILRENASSSAPFNFLKKVTTVLPCEQSKGMAQRYSSRGMFAHIWYTIKKWGKL